MYAKVSAILVVCAMVLIAVQPAVASDLPAPKDYQLPDKMTFDDITNVSSRIYRDHCMSSSCLGYLRVTAAFLLNYYGRGSAGNAYIGHIPNSEERDIRVGRDLAVLLRDNRPLWPWMCKALVAIQARDDIGDDSYSPIATYSLDTARRISTRRLDCLGQVSALIPPSKYRKRSLFYVQRYCESDRARDCWRVAH